MPRNGQKNNPPGSGGLLPRLDLNMCRTSRGHYKVFGICGSSCASACDCLIATVGLVDRAIRLPGLIGSKWREEFFGKT